MIIFYNHRLQLRQVIVEGHYTPAEPNTNGKVVEKPMSEQDEIDKRLASSNARGTYPLLLSKYVEFNRILSYKEIWRTLDVEHEDTNQIYESNHFIPCIYMMMRLLPLNP